MLTTNRMAEVEDEPQFDSADAGASKTYPQQASRLG
jgi:hypothetical protein